VFDGATVPATLAIFRNLVVASSWSKSLALPGERIGFACVHPQADDMKELLAAMAYAIRALGFINAPAIFQRVIERSIDARCDLASYVDRRARLLSVLADAGFSCTPPQGALYLFVKSPEPDDVAFSARAAAHRVLVVPGIAFGYPGYFRLTYCVSVKTIEDSRASWNAIAAEYGLKR
jgi:aspartate aminotransferase